MVNIKEQIIDIMVKDIARLLKINKNSFWYNNVGSIEHNTVSESALEKSLKCIIECEVSRTKIEDLDKRVIELADLIIEYWNVIRSRWPECFEYKNGFNIYKSVGVFSLHIVLKNIIMHSTKESIISMSKVIILNNKLDYTVWLSGGPFTGMTNSKDILKVADKIMSSV